MSREKTGTKLQILCMGNEELRENSLRNYQKKTIDALKKLDDKGNFSTIVNLPTGAGKTIIGIQFCLYELEKGAKVLWIADRIALLEQTLSRFARIKSEKEYTYQLICSQSKNRNIEESIEDTEEVNSIKYQPLGKISKDADIILASVGTIAGVAEKECAGFRDWLEESQSNGQRLYIIYDEAHHIGANRVSNFFSSLLSDVEYKNTRCKYKDVLKKFGIIGLTATVYRGDKYLDVFNEWFKDGYDREKNETTHICSPYGDSSIREDESDKSNRIAIVDIRELIAGCDGEPPVLLAPQIIKVNEYENGKPESVEKEMEYLAHRIKKRYKEWGKIAVVVDNKQYAQNLQEQLSKVGVQSFPFISGNEGNVEELRKFKECEVADKILIAVNMLNEGIDIPDLNTLYLYAPTKSQVILRQRIGRLLRKAEGKEKESRLIWQYYPKGCGKLSSEKFEELLKMDRFPDAAETDEEMKKDIQEWKNDHNIPPAMYLETLPGNGEPQKCYSTFCIFKALELFGTENIEKKDSVGYYYDAETFEDTDVAIFVRDVERKGYRQLLRVLQNDWQVFLRYHEHCQDFKQYAELLSITEAELLKDIKKVCFYLSDVKREDTSGDEIKKRIFVRDGDIKIFFHWFMQGDIAYRQLEVSGTGNERMSDAKLFDKFNTEKPQAIGYCCKESCLSVIKQKIDSSKSKSSVSIGKEYTDLLSYGKDGKQIYQEMQSVKFLMRMGAVGRQRVSNPKNEKEDWAFVGITEQGEEKEVSHVRRMANSSFQKDDWLLIASALVDMPNHIWMKQEDVDEYENRLSAWLVKQKYSVNKEQVIKEFLMALGYAENDDIVRRQCEIFGEELPKILQYILYEKAYKKLEEKLKEFFEDAHNSDVAVYESKKELESEYKILKEKYRICGKQMDNFTPVEDLIYDYRPYLKTVSHYQGIKPEFLCRMVNDTVQMIKGTTVGTVIDAFGGSGACTMNGFYKKIEPNRVYNDLGIMNTAFYRCLQNKQDKAALEREIKKLIDMAFSSYDPSDCMKGFWGKYANYLQEKTVNNSSSKSAMAILEKTISGCEEEYIKKYDKLIKEYRDNNKGADIKSYRTIWLENRLAYGHEMFFEKIRGEKKGEEIPDGFRQACRSIERYFHVLMRKVDAIYKVIKDDESTENALKYGIGNVEFGILFFLHNSLSNRHFYNDCTIALICDFVRNYKTWLEAGEEQFNGVIIEQKDALELLKEDEYNKEDSVWYLDIPYIGTNWSDYVSNDSAKAFELKLQESLAGCRGVYIVSSRCNICASAEDKEKYDDKSWYNKDEQDDISDEEVNGKETEKTVLRQKEEDIFKFFDCFVSKEDADEYEKYINSNDKNHLPSAQAAKYILIPYTRRQEDFFKKEGDDKGKRGSLEKNNTKLSRHCVRRMIAATHFSNIPVEVMITNADLELNSDTIHKLDEGIWALPTFKTGLDASQYMVEPLIIIMEYKKFIRVLLQLLYHEEYMEYKNKKEIKAASEYFRQYRP